MVGTQPLTRGQQLLVQRLMARHIMTDRQAKDAFDELLPSMDNCCETMEECFIQINQQISKGFGLEIATASLMVDVPESQEGEETSSPKAVRQKFHTIINQHNDEVAKMSFGMHFDPNERALMRLIFEHLVNIHPSPSPQSVLVNLRSQLDQKYRLTVAGAKGCIRVMLEEKWLNHAQDGGLLIGIRALLELSHLLAEFGLSEDDQPQFMFHRL